ncbi:unnamed protein product [Parajaminaea phylloscopi]
MVDAATSARHTSDTFRPLLKQLILSLPVPGVVPHPSRAAPSQLGQEDLRLLFQHLADPDFTSNHANQAQLGSVLSGLRLGGVDIQPETLLVASETFLSKSIPVDSQDGHSELSKRATVERRIREEPGWASSSDAKEAESLIETCSSYAGTLDLVGTGGDGQDTFNVSTTAAIVASGVPGVRICKHGAKASSSTSGSADLLLSLGLPLLSLTPSTIATLLPQTPFCFLFAQLFHPSLAPLAPIRRALGHPTIFNVLGPLINPAQPKRCILGVHSSYLGRIFVEALRSRGCQRAWVVCGQEGLDEISIEGETDVWQLIDGEIKQLVISPKDFGLTSHPLKNVASYTSQENAAIVMTLLERGDQGSGDAGEQLEAEVAASLPAVPPGADLEAITDYTLLQTAALLYVGGYAGESYLEATRLARHSMKGGAARGALRRFRVLAHDAVTRQQKEQEAAQSAKDAEAEARRRATQRESKAARDSLLDERKDEYFYAPEPVRSIAVGTDD